MDGNMHIKRCSTSLVIKEINTQPQIYTTAPLNKIK